MSLHIALIVASCTLLPAAMFQMFPLWQRSFLFTVRVAPDFAGSAEGRRIVSAFRAGTWCIAIVCAAAALAGIANSAPWAMAVAPIVNCAAMAALFFHARSRTLPFAAPAGGAVRRAVLSADADVEPWWTWAAPMAGLALLGGAVAFLAGNWDRIPDPSPIHWGLNGLPDRWAPKSVARVAALLLCGLSTHALTTLILYGLGHSGPPSARRRMNQALTAWVNVTASGIIAMVLLLPFRGALAIPSGTLWTLGPMALLTAPAIWLSIKLQQVEIEEEEPARDESWIGGILYSDAADSRMMVPNRMGPGYGFNLGHPVMRYAFPGLILVILAAAFSPAFL